MKKFTQVTTCLFIWLVASSPYSSIEAQGGKFRIDVDAIKISDAVVVTPEVHLAERELKPGKLQLQEKQRIQAPEGYRFVRFMITVESIPRTKLRITQNDFLLHKNGSESIPVSTFYYLSNLSDIDKNRIPKSFAWNFVPGGIASYLMAFEVPTEHIDDYQFIVLENNLGTIEEIQDRLG
jgi:hypothetical protein